MCEIIYRRSFSVKGLDCFDYIRFIHLQWDIRRTWYLFKVVSHGSSASAPDHAVNSKYKFKTVSKLNIHHI